MTNLNNVVEEMEIIEQELGLFVKFDEDECANVLHGDSRDFSNEDFHAMPFSDSDIDVLNRVENEKYGLGGGEYWRR